MDFSLSDFLYYAQNHSLPEIAKLNSSTVGRAESSFTICLIHRRQQHDRAADFISVSGRWKLWVLSLIIFENVGLTRRQDDPHNK